LQLAGPVVHCTGPGKRATVRATIAPAGDAHLPLSQPLRIHELSPEELTVYRTLDPTRMPEHVAIIMDGNGRWAGKP
jgi:hypothetical protein